MTSIHKKYAEVTRRYYGTNVDPFRFPPAVYDEDVAHGLAIEIDRKLSEIDEAELVAEALHAQTENKYNGRETDLEILREVALVERLQTVVFDTEVDHYRHAPEDFNEDSAKGGTFVLNDDMDMAPKPEPPHDMPGPRRGE